MAGNDVLKYDKSRTWPDYNMSMLSAFNVSKNLLAHCYLIYC